MASSANKVILVGNLGRGHKHVKSIICGQFAVPYLTFPHL